MLTRYVLTALLIGAMAWGRASQKVFYFTYVRSPQGLQDVTNTVKATGDIRDVLLDAAKRSLTVTGTPEQVAIAGWLAGEMDTPGSSPGTRDMAFSDPRASLAQMYYLTRVETPQELQEMVNAVRSITNLHRCFRMSQQKAIVMRAMPDQIKAADWMLGIIDQAGGGGPFDYRLPSIGTPIGRWRFKRFA